jgi:peptidoglycan hydrolase-like protein with peptidoglycan-binding domain
MLIAESADEPSLSRDDVFAIQTTLNELGFNAGEPDGFSGPKTRNATRDYIERGLNSKYIITTQRWLISRLSNKHRLPIKAVRQMTNR